VHTLAATAITPGGRSSPETRSLSGYESPEPSVSFSDYLREQHPTRKSDIDGSNRSGSPDSSGDSSAASARYGPVDTTSKKAHKESREIPVGNGPKDRSDSDESEKAASAGLAHSSPGDERLKALKDDASVKASLAGSGGTTEAKGVTGESVRLDGIFHGDPAVGTKNAEGGRGKRGTLVNADSAAAAGDSGGNHDSEAAKVSKQRSGQRPDAPSGTGGSGNGGASIDGGATGADTHRDGDTAHLRAGESAAAAETAASRTGKTAGQKDTISADESTTLAGASSAPKGGLRRRGDGIFKETSPKGTVGRADSGRDGTTVGKGTDRPTDPTAQRIVKDIEVHLDTGDQGGANSGNAEFDVDGLSATADSKGDLRDGDLSSFLTRVEHAPATTVHRGATPAEAAGALARRLNGELGGTIVRQAKVMLKEAEQAEIRLIIRPPELGRVRINLQMENGHIAGRILVDNGNVRDAIEQNLAALQRAFEEAGLEVGDFEVSTGDGRQEAADDGSSHSGRRETSAPSVADRFTDSVEPIVVSEYSHRRINLVA